MHTSHSLKLVERNDIAMISHLSLLRCEPLNYFSIAIIGIVFAIAVNVTMVLLCLYYHKTWKPKHQRAPVSGRVAFDGHRGGDESYVMIDLHSVRHLSMTVRCMCVVQNNMLRDSIHLVQCFFLKKCTTSPQFMIYCIACL